MNKRFLTGFLSILLFFSAAVLVVAMEQGAFILKEIE
jgi:hypothetical protein